VKREARQRSADKGKRKAQLSAADRAAWVKKFKERERRTPERESVRETTPAS
jgi:hypothetical protein